MTLEEILPYIALQRVIERSVIFLFVIALVAVLLVIYRRAIQRISFDVTVDKVGAAGATAFAMPVFLLLVLVGFSYVLLSQPISLESDGDKVAVRHAASSIDGTAIDEKTLMAALAVSTEFSGELEIEDEATRRRISSANRVLELLFAELVDAEFGDGTYGFYVETKAKLAGVPSIEALGLPSDQADRFLEIDSFFDGSEILEGN